MILLKHILVAPDFSDAPTAAIDCGPALVRTFGAFTLRLRFLPGGPAHPPIVMGTHGRGAIAQLLVGSVAEKVVRTAPCPVLTVRHPEHEFVVPDAADTTANQKPGGLS